MKVAVIGLGAIGFGIAALMIRAGLQVTGTDVKPNLAARFAVEHGKGCRIPTKTAVGGHRRYGGRRNSDFQCAAALPNA